MITLSIDNNSSVQKYLQIVNSVINDIENGILKLDDQLPSINELSEEYYLSRDTVEKAYNVLKERGIIKSIPGKGYFICNTKVLDKIKVFLLFNKLSNYKKIVYDSFVEALGDKVQVDLYIYHNDPIIFENIISENIGKYKYFLVAPYFFKIDDTIKEILNRIPEDKLIILDREVTELSGRKPKSVYQNFEMDIYNALHSLHDLIEKYQKLVLVFPEGTYYPEEIKMGFEKFCAESSVACDIIPSINYSNVDINTAYVALDEKDLMILLKKIKDNDLKPGRNIGIISYNDSPLKEFLYEGITVISTNFENIGKEAAMMVLNKKKGRIANPFQVIRRSSL